MGMDKETLNIWFVLLLIFLGGIIIGSIFQIVYDKYVITKEDDSCVSSGICAAMVVNVSGECGLQLNNAYVQGQQDTLINVVSQLEGNGEVTLGLGNGRFLVLVPKQLSEVEVNKFNCELKGCEFSEESGCVCTTGNTQRAE